ncbi:MAG TPA: tetratricopeptide repeat protein, partial [Armatimonadota bacterium]|nr:tetratricopeptide repeat protein [Armatimonadota bacterium]
ERQCFLQSVLISGLLQEMGMDAGVVMVSRNEKGQDTNNGHAVSLLKLPDGTDILVDASDPQPFARQQGLFVVEKGSYRYVLPAFESASPVIRQYTTVARHRTLTPREVRTLDTAFLRSQFDYYRGERAPGGLIVGKKSPAGLESAASYLRASLQHCPGNPLSAFVLGRVYRAQGKSAEAERQFRSAYALYTRYGWVPAGPRAAAGKG